MELQYRGFTIITVVTEVRGAFGSSLEILDEHDRRRNFSDIGRFASPNAASNFAVMWATAFLDNKPLPLPPYKLAQGTNL